jgi:hypothetical protein
MKTILKFQLLCFLNFQESSSLSFYKVPVEYIKHVNKKIIYGTVTVALIGIGLFNKERIKLFILKKFINKKETPFEKNQEPTSKIIENFMDPPFNNSIPSNNQKLTLEEHKSILNKKFLMLELNVINSIKINRKSGNIDDKKIKKFKNSLIFIHEKILSANSLLELEKDVSFINKVNNLSVEIFQQLDETSKSNLKEILLSLDDFLEELKCFLPFIKSFDKLIYENQSGNNESYNKMNFQLIKKISDLSINILKIAIFDNKNGIINEIEEGIEQNKKHFLFLDFLKKLPEKIKNYFKYLTEINTKLLLFNSIEDLRKDIIFKNKMEEFINYFYSCKITEDISTLEELREGVITNSRFLPIVDEYHKILGSLLLNGKKIPKLSL